VSDSQIYELECNLVALLAGALLLVFLVRRLRRSQPGLAIGAAVATAFGVRVLAALALNQLTFAEQLRGGDELTFLGRAQGLAHLSFGSAETAKALTHQFHTFVFSLSYRLFGTVPQTTLRIEAIAVSVAGLTLLAAAVYELAGRRPAVITAWVLAFEPASVFFSGIIHKEPFMMLAEGMVAYGGARLWKRGELRALAPMIVGCLLATATRPYVGWFLAAASACIALHAGLRRHSASHSLALSAVVAALIVAFIPTVWNASSKHHLQALQISQTANAADTSANLSLEQVDYSTRGKIIVNLPTRILDITTKPYPWQLQNTSQRLGATGAIFLIVLIVVLLWTLVRRKGIMRRAGPLVYPAIFLLIAYSISAGNAGTAFRYRTHIIAFLVALLFVLRKQPSEAEAAEAAEPVDRHHFVLGRTSVPTLAK
jgi:hypothetical protein